jgi:hypothetical protein
MALSGLRINLHEVRTSASASFAVQNRVENAFEARIDSTDESRSDTVLEICDASQNGDLIGFSDLAPASNTEIEQVTTSDHFDPPAPTAVGKARI